MTGPEVLMPDGAIKRQGDSLVPQGVVFAAYATGNPTVAQGVAIPYNTELFDPYGWFDSATNYRFQPQIPGYYRVSFSVRDNAPPSPGWSRAQLWKNGAIALIDGDFQTSSPGESSGTTIAYLNGTTDYLDVRRYRSDANSGVLTATAPEHSHFSAQLVGTSVGVIPEPWHVIGATGEPAFQNGYSTAGGFAAVAFYKDPLGVVRIKGSAAGGTSGGTIFTLPVGYRPLGLLHYPAADINTAPMEVRIDSNGAVLVFFGGALSAAGVPLDQITFRAEQ